MIVVFDANCLVCWSSERAVHEDDRARLENLVTTTTSAGGKIIIPAPAFAEFLVGINESAADWLNALERKKAIVIAAFDKRCAFEVSLMDKAALGQGDKKSGRSGPWQLIKIDRQIVAVARVNGANLLISHDAGLRATATLTGLEARDIADLDLPAQARQTKLGFEDSDTAATPPPP